MTRIKHPWTMLVLGATMAAGLLSLAAIEPAGAAFPGTNGKIAFTSTRDGNREIYVMNADGTGQNRLTSNTVIDEAPAFSPDGSRIAFSRNNGGSFGVYVVNAPSKTKDNEVQINEVKIGSGRDPTFSPDGSKVAFNGGGDIRIMNVDGSGTPTSLTSDPAEDRAPAWSPDGSKVAFVSDRMDQEDLSTDDDIWVVNADGSGAPTNNHGGVDRDSTLTWSPDGSKIAFDAPASTSREIFVMNADGSSVTPITDANPNDADGDRNPGRQLQPAFSPDGGKIAFFDDPTDEVWAMNSDGSGMPVNVSNAAGINDQPDWAPLSFDLSLVQSDTPDPVKVGGNLTYTLEVTNDGFDDAPGVVLTDRLPTGVAFVSASTGCTHVLGEVTCNLGTVAPFATVPKTVTVTPASAGTITNTASVESTAEEVTYAGNNADRERTEVTLNRAPVADDDSYVTREDTPLSVPAPGVLADDTDADGDPLQLIRVVETTGGGALTSGRDGSFTYTPSLNSNGADAFTYRASDGTAESNTATVTVVVRAVNDPPNAADDAAQAAQETPLDVAVLANDRDPDKDELAVTSASDPAHGATTRKADNTVRYVPDASYIGPDSFTYTVADPGGATDTATVNVTVSDTKAPTVAKALPVGKKVRPGANVTALFSEPMAAGTLFHAATGESTTFVLKKGTVKIPAKVGYDPGSLTATLNPDGKLRRGATYTATVTTGAKDTAGIPLDQNPNTAGNQAKVWSFKIRP